MRNLNRYLRGAIAGAGAALLIAPMAQAQAQAETSEGDERLSSRDRSVILLHVIADKGTECGLLDEWEGMVIKVQARQERQNWDKARRERAARHIADDLATKDCDDGLINGWIDAAKRNLSAEGLAPFLVMYQELAKLDMPPAMFDGATQRLDYTDEIAKIEAEFERLEASGLKAEGGKEWDEYRAGLKVFLDEALEALDSGDLNTSRKAGQALTYIATSVRVVETWLEETKIDPSPE